jgi:hypothetical protein
LFLYFSSEPKFGLKKAGKKYELMRKKSSGDVPTTGRSGGSGGGSSFRKSSSGYSHLGCCSAVPYNLAEEPDHLGENLSRTPAKAVQHPPCPVRLADPAGDNCGSSLSAAAAVRTFSHCTEEKERLQLSVDAAAAVKSSECYRPPAVSEKDVKGREEDEDASGSSPVATPEDVSPMSEQSGYVTNSNNSSDSVHSTTVTTPTSSEEEVAATRTISVGCTQYGGRETAAGTKNGLGPIKSEDECEDDGDTDGAVQAAESRSSVMNGQGESSNISSPRSRQQLQSPSLLLGRTHRARSEEPTRGAADHPRDEGEARRPRLKSQSVSGDTANRVAASNDLAPSPPANLKEPKDLPVSAMSSKQPKVDGSIPPPRAFRDIAFRSPSGGGRRGQAATEYDHLRYLSLWVENFFTRQIPYELLI